MKRVLAFALAFAAAGSVALADDDPIAARQALMKANGATLKQIIPMLKGGPFDLETVQKSLNVYIDAATKEPALFPPGSDKGKTAALPAIWTNTADFDARFVKLGADSKAALASIKDADSFKAAFPGVLKNCGGCHETYRAKDN
jgi:cytochrome c556